MENDGKKIFFNDFENLRKDLDTLIDSQSTLFQFNDEKANFLALIEKNEKILKISQNFLEKDKKSLINEFKESENLYKNQILSLTQENNLYKSEIERLNKKILSQTEKLAQYESDSKFSKEEFLNLKKQNEENIKENSFLKEKIKKIENFYKQKEEKLKTELQESKSKYSELESEFYKKIEKLSSQVNPKNNLKTSGISQDQLKTLMNQKKVLENSFLQEKQNLIRENENYSKKITQLKKNILLEKEKVLSIENQLEYNQKSWMDDVERLNKIIESLEQELYEKNIEKNETVEALNQVFIDRENEFCKIFSEIQEQLNEYKKNSENVIETDENNRKINEFIENSCNIYKKIKKIRENLNPLIQNLINLLETSLENQNKTENFGIVQENNLKSEELTQLLQNAKNLIKNAENDKSRIEKQQEDLFNYLKTHEKQWLELENNRLLEFTSLRNENKDLHQKILDLQTEKMRKTENSKDFKQISEDLAFQNKGLIQKLEKKIQSVHKKNECDIRSWGLQEELYKKTIKTLTDQQKRQISLETHTKNFKKLKPELKTRQKSLILIDLKQKDFEIQNLSNLLKTQESFHLAQKKIFFEAFSKLSKFDFELFTYYEFFICKMLELKNSFDS